MIDETWIETALAGLFGLLAGSFLNVCIHRWPRDLSVVKPRSACPSCGNPIAAYDNIPVVSYLALRARCRHCGERIHWRYPTVELLTSAVFAWFAWRLGLGLVTVKYCVFAALLIGLIFSDIETLILPDEFTLGGLAIGLVFSRFVAVPDSTFGLLASLLGFSPGPRAASFGEAMLGAFLPACTLWLVGWLFEKLRHKEGLGLGDVKMIAMVGSFLGLGGALLTVIAGSLTGAVVGGGYIVATKKDASTFRLPFATFLGAGALFAAMGGQAWYQDLFSGKY
jgi:leader peptidase (prepilin peptidase)/N-methyltransferase